MRKVTIASMSLLNFKGIQNLKIDFEHETNIFGDNAAGKTTVFDAFTWLLFGKDSTDRKDFEIKTLDKNNKAIEKIEHEVSAALYNGEELITLRRVLRENWVKKRGSEKSEFTGNTTEYYYNDVPMQAKEYQAKINAIIEESVFKLITNPLAFNATTWQNRRAALMNIAGEISDEVIAGKDENYLKLLKEKGSEKTMDEYKKQIQASIKKAKENLAAIPTRIDEATRSKPQQYDFDDLETQAAKLKKDITEVENKIADKSKLFDANIDKANAAKLALNTAKQSAADIEYKARKTAKDSLKFDDSAITKKQDDLKELQQKERSYIAAAATLKIQLENKTADLANTDLKTDETRKKWHSENAKKFEFNESECVCPTCKRSFESDDIESKKAEMLTNFNTEKAEAIARINATGAQLKTEKENLAAEISVLNERIKAGADLQEKISKEITDLEAEIKTMPTAPAQHDQMQEDLIFESALSIDPDYKKLRAEITEMESKSYDIKPVDISELQQEKATFQTSLHDVQAKMLNKTQIEAVGARINALLDEEKTLSHQIANVEKDQFLIDNFIKLRIETLEQEINSMFQNVKFKMFEEQINGGLAETCQCLINGVPFSDANTAGKINAGLDIINTLCRFYDVTAPIFIDNRESIIKLIETQSQVVNLIVSKGSALSVGAPTV